MVLRESRRGSLQWSSCFVGGLSIYMHSGYLAGIILDHEIGDRKVINKKLNNDLFWEQDISVKAIFEMG